MQKNKFVIKMLKKELWKRDKNEPNKRNKDRKKRKKTKK